jgi:hypothetical protein
MDPFTLALATFGVQKLRGKSTKTALKSAAIVGGGAFGFQQLAAAGSIPGVTAGQGIGKIGSGNAFSGLKSLLGQRAIPAQEVVKDSTGKVIQEATKEQVGKGLLGMDTGTKLITASTLLPLLGEDEEVKPQFTEEDYKQAYKEQSQKLEGKFKPVDMNVAKPTMADVTGSNMFYANQGGLANMLPKYNQGGVNYLPSKVDHDENDVNNYVRAQGYVEDGAGVGDKDEDTMLAQLADGEFVSRADAVLGAGILSGADPKNFKGMRKAGADFFYNQQKQLKRIYDITNASKQN